MFDNRYLTCGVDSTIPLELQLFLWECVEHMPAPKDYLQVFELSPSGSMQSIQSADEVASDVIDGKLNPIHHNNDKKEVK